MSIMSLYTDRKQRRSQRVFGPRKHESKAKEFHIICSTWDRVSGPQ